MDTKSLSIIIVNWNTTDRLLRCLESVENADRACVSRLEVVVVDNASKIKYQSDRSYSFRLVLIQNSINEGFAKACNRGALAAKGDYLLFLNPDTRIGKDTIESSIREYERLKRYGSRSDNRVPVIGALGVQITDETGNVQRTCSRLPKLRYFVAKAFGLNQLVPSWNLFLKDWDHADSRFVEEIMGAFFFMERSRFHKFRGFDERFFMYYEEVDLCKRLFDSGYGIYYTVETSIYHEAGAASGQIKGKRLFYELRSRYLYFEKHFRRSTLKLLMILIRQEQLTRNVKALRCSEGKKMPEGERLEINQAYTEFYKWRKKKSAGSVRKTW